MPRQLVRRAFAHARMLAVVGAIAGTLIASATAQAATFTVNSTVDAALRTAGAKTCVSTYGGRCTLRAAVQAADNLKGASTIVLPAGSYRFTRPSTAADDPSSGDLDVNAGVTLTVRGAGAGRTVIDANHIDRAFTVQPPAGAQSAGALTVERLTITRGDAQATPRSSNASSTSPGYAGAILNLGRLSLVDVALVDDAASGLGGAVTALPPATSTSVDGSSITGSYASAPGGGISVIGGALTVTRTRFAGDTAYSGMGGAIYISSGDALKLSADSFSHDAAFDGGAVYDGSGPATISASSFIDNTLLVPGDGGALALEDTATNHAASVTGSTFAGNTGAVSGGAVYVEGSSPVTLAGDLFNDNSAFAGGGGQGGAVMDVDGGPMILRDSTFNGNQASTGGAIDLDSAGAATVTGNTIVNSFAIQQGGGVDVAYSGTATLARNTIVDNFGGQGGGIYDPANLVGLVDTLVAGNSGGDCSAVAGSADKGHNLDGDGSCFSSGGSPEAAGDLPAHAPKLGPLGNYGGSLPTLALLSGSPAIGAGVCGLPGVTTDARGVRLPSSRCDIGAFQTADSNLILRATHGRPRLHRRLALHFRITSAGSGPALATRLTIMLPAHMKLVGAHPSRGRCAGRRKVSCLIGLLNSPSTGGSRTATVTVVVVPQHRGRPRVRATLASSTTDSSPRNNRATLRLRIR